MATASRRSSWPPGAVGATCWTLLERRGVPLGAPGVAAAGRRLRPGRCRHRASASRRGSPGSWRARWPKAASCSPSSRASGIPRAFGCSSISAFPSARRSRRATATSTSRRTARRSTWRRGGAAPTVQLLLERGASVNATGRQGTHAPGARGAAPAWTPTGPSGARPESAARAARGRRIRARRSVSERLRRGRRALAIARPLGSGLITSRGRDARPRSRPSPAGGRSTPASGGPRAPPSPRRRELLREPGLQPRVDDDRRAQRDMVAHEVHGRGVDVGRGLEAREGRPQEVDRAGGGAPRLVGQHDERPARERGMRGDALAGAGSASKGGPPTTRQPPQNTRASKTSDGSDGARNSRGSVRTGSPRPSHTPFEPSLTSAPCSRACPSRDWRTRRVGLGSRARQHVLEGGAEIEQVHGPVGDEQELGQRQLPLAEDPERARHGFPR